MDKDNNVIRILTRGRSYFHILIQGRSVREVKDEFSKPLCLVKRSFSVHSCLYMFLKKLYYSSGKCLRGDLIIETEWGSLYTVFRGLLSRGL